MNLLNRLFACVLLCLGSAPVSNMGAPADNLAGPIIGNYWNGDVFVMNTGPGVAYVQPATAPNNGDFNSKVLFRNPSTWNGIMYMDDHDTVISWNQPALHASGSGGTILVFGAHTRVQVNNTASPYVPPVTPIRVWHHVGIYWVVRFVWPGQVYVVNY